MKKFLVVVALSVVFAIVQHGIVFSNDTQLPKTDQDLIESFEARVKSIDYSLGKITEQIQQGEAYVAQQKQNKQQLLGQKAELQFVIKKKPSKQENPLEPVASDSTPVPSQDKEASNQKQK